MACDITVLSHSVKEEQQKPAFKPR